MTASVTEAEAGAAAAKAGVDRAEAQIASGGKNVTAAALHKLRDAWRHADLTAQGARERAERDRQAARLAGLEEIGNQADALAASALNGMPEALQAVADAAARVREIAAAHDAAVAGLTAAAADLGAEPTAPAGPRRTSAFVAVDGQSVIHKTTRVSPVSGQLTQAMDCAVNGDMPGSLAALAPVLNLTPAPRPDYLLRGANGMLIPATGPLAPAMEAHVRSGEVALLPEQDIDAYMAGELA